MNKPKHISALAMIALLCAGGALFLYLSGFFSLNSVEDLQGYILRFAPYSHLIFFLIQFLSVILAPIPSNISAAAGGILFGTWPSFFLTFAAVFCGSLLVFHLSRVLGQPFAERMVSQRLSQKYQAILRQKASAFLALAFLFPFFPDDVLCILAGLTPIRYQRFICILLLTRPWGLLFASALGGATLNVSPWIMLPLGLAGTTLFLLGLRYSEQIEAGILRRLNKPDRF